MQGDAWSGHYEPISYAPTTAGQGQLGGAAVTNVIRNGRAVSAAAAAAAAVDGAASAVDPARFLANATHLSASASLTASKSDLHI